MIYRCTENTGIQEGVTKHYRDKEGNKLPESYREKKVTLHTLRHTFAQRIYAEIQRILDRYQKALGYSDFPPQ